MAVAAPVQERAAQERAEHKASPEAAFSEVVAEYLADVPWDQEARTTQAMLAKLDAVAELSLEPLQHAEIVRMSCYGQEQLISLTVGGCRLPEQNDFSSELTANTIALAALRDAPEPVRENALGTLLECHDRLQATVPILEKQLDGEAETKNSPVFCRSLIKLKRILRRSCTTIQKFSGKSLLGSSTQEKLLPKLGRAIYARQCRRV